MDLISGISLICFAASYAVAWALEVSQLFRPGVTRRWLMVGFVAAGLLAHTLYLGYRALELSASPLSSSFDWSLVAAWLLMGAYVYLAYYYPRAALGLYMLPLVLVLIGRGGAFRSPALGAGRARRACRAPFTASFCCWAR